MPKLKKSVSQCLSKCLPPKKDAYDDDGEAAIIGLGKYSPDEVMSVVPPWRGFDTLRRWQYDRIVTAPTAEERWFTPRGGWPDVKYAGSVQPVNLMLTAAEAPEVFLPPRASLGELRVELLETDGLTNMDTFGLNDVYAIVVFEDSIAATRPISDVRSPRFHNECARAFKFPIINPASSVYIGLLDCDADEYVNAAFSNLTWALDQVDPTVEKVLSAVERCTGASEAAGAAASSSASELRARVRSNAAAAAAELRRRYNEWSAPAAAAENADPESDDDRPTREQESATRREEMANRRARLMSRAEDAIKDDDPIGRVEIDLRCLHPGTVYDCWYELRRSKTLDDKGRHGAIRVRYSINWSVPERQRVLAYMQTPPLFATPIPSGHFVQRVQYAIHGTEGSKSDGDTVFSLARLKSHGREFKGYMKGGVYWVMDGIEDIVLYKHVLSSIVVCVLWQLVCTYPFLLPSCGPLSLLVIMRTNYLTVHAACDPINRPPSFVCYASALLLPRWIYELPPIQGLIKASQYPIAKQRDVLAERVRALKEAELEEERALARREAFEIAYQKHKDSIKLRRETSAAVGAIASRTIGGLSREVAGTVDEMKALLSQARVEVAQGRYMAAAGRITTHSVRAATGWVTSAAHFVVDAVRDAGIQAKRWGVTVFSTSKDAVDPMQLVAAYLQPVQEQLSGYLVTLRGVHGVLMWHDHALSTYLCLMQMVLVVVFPFLPWLVICRVLGMIVLGPHMAYFGHQQRKAAAEVAKAEEFAEHVAKRYAEAKGEAERSRLLREEHQRREVQAKKEAVEMDKYLAGLPYADHARRRKQHGNSAVIVHGSRVKEYKLDCMPDPLRSAAHPEDYFRRGAPMTLGEQLEWQKLSEGVASEQPLHVQLAEWAEAWMQRGREWADGRRHARAAPPADAKLEAESEAKLKQLVDSGIRDRQLRERLQRAKSAMEVNGGATWATSAGAAATAVGTPTRGRLAGRRLSYPDSVSGAPTGSEADNSVAGSEAGSEVGVKVQPSPNSKLLGHPLRR